MEFLDFGGLGSSGVNEKQAGMVWSSSEGEGVMNYVDEGQYSSSTIPMPVPTQAGGYPQMNSSGNAVSIDYEIQIQELEKQMLDDSEVDCLDENQVLETMNSFLEATGNPNNNINVTTSNTYNTSVIANDTVSAWRYMKSLINWYYVLKHLLKFSCE